MGKNNNNYNRVPGAAGGGRGIEKERIQQSASTHSGAGEKQTPNINDVEKDGMEIEKTKTYKDRYIYIFESDPQIISLAMVFQFKGRYAVFKYEKNSMGIFEEIGIACINMSGTPKH